MAPPSSRAPDPGAPYRPPPIDGRGEPTPLQPRAVAVGVAVDWGATWITSSAILFLALAVASARYETAEEIESYLQQLSAAPDFVVLTSLVGLMCVSLGAFVAAAVAGAGARRHALAVGLCSLVLSLVLDAMSEGDAVGWYPLWFRVLGYVLVVPAALLGGALAERVGLVKDSGPG